jgi:hypothetical protein
VSVLLSGGVTCRLKISELIDQVFPNRRLLHRVTIPDHIVDLDSLTQESRDPTDVISIRMRHEDGVDPGYSLAAEILQERSAGAGIDQNGFVPAAHNDAASVPDIEYIHYRRSFDASGHAVGTSQSDR